MLNSDKIIKVIVFDDDILLGNMIVSILKEEKMEAVYQSSLYGAKEAVLSFEPDIIVLDVEMGEDSGIDFASEMQSRGITTPILFVSSHVRGYEVAQGIQAGGKVYIKKPFDMEELIVYIRQYACSSSGYSHLINFGRLQLNRETRDLFLENRLIKKLSKIEYQILLLLIEKQGEVVPRSRFFKEIWDDCDIYDASLNNFISKLRAFLLLDDSLTIRTLPDIGYMLFIDERNGNN